MYYNADDEDEKCIFYLSFIVKVKYKAEEKEFINVDKKKYISFVSSNSNRIGMDVSNVVTLDK